MRARSGLSTGIITFAALLAAPTTFAQIIHVDREGEWSLTIYDVGGRHVRWITGGTGGSGPQQAEWDGLDAGGRRVPRGV